MGKQRQLLTTLCPIHASPLIQFSDRISIARQLKIRQQ
jgi:hypothetical protein